MKNILFLSSWFPSKVHTSLGNFVKYHALAASKFNNIYVLYIIADDSINSYEIDSFKENNLSITIVYFKRGVTKYLNYLIAFRKGLKFLIKKNDLKLDLVHMNIMHPGIWQALYLKYFYKLNYIVSENWHGFQDLSKYQLSYLQTKLIECGFKNSSMICPVSKQLKNCMKQAGFKASFTIVPNVVNTDIFNLPIRKPTSKNFTFLHISTLNDSIKNVSGIIDAFEKLKQSNLTLKIIGDGPIDWILERINNLKSSNSVIIESEMKHEDIAKEIQLADVFILFSNIENLPLVLIESISCGTPFISSNVGGVGELHNKEVGILVEAGNIKALTTEMNYFINNYKLYHPEKIRQYAIDQYSEDVVGNKFNDLYIEYSK